MSRSTDSARELHRLDPGSPARFYTFDWQVWSGPYLRLTVPSRPMLLTDMPAHLVPLADAVLLPMNFGAVAEVSLEGAGIEIALADDG